MNYTGKLFLLMLFIGIAHITSAETIGGTDGNIRWSLDLESGVLTMEGDGNMKDYSSPGSVGGADAAPWNKDSNGKLVRSVVIGKGITSIGSYAFHSCDKLETALLPEGIEQIGMDAFYGCSSLTTIVFPESLKAIQMEAFQNSGLTKLNLPSKLTSISWMCFAGCSRLTSLVIPGGVVTIDEYAFWQCTGLKSIEMPHSLVTIGEYAFYGCSEMLILDFPEGVKTIGGHAFENCVGLKSVAFPQSLTQIGTCAFRNCNSLVDVINWSKTPQSLRADVFSIYGTLHVLTGYAEDYSNSPNWRVFTIVEDITPSKGIDGSIEWIFDSKNGTLVINGGGEMKNYGEGTDSLDVAPWRFYFNEKIREVYVSRGVTSIGANAFNSAKSLSRVNLSGVQYIGANAFKNCPKLRNIYNTDDVTSIEAGAFDGCTSLESINLPEGLKSIGRGAFKGCLSLTSINLPKGLTAIGEEVFSDCVGLIEIAIPEGVKSLPSHAFSGCAALTSVTLPGGLESIGDGAFMECGIQNLELPQSIKEIGGWAFSSSRLNTVNLPCDLKVISPGLFYRCLLLTDTVSIPDGVVSIGEEAFRLSGVHAVIIPESVTAIGKEAFRDCSYIQSFTFPKEIEDIDEGVLRFCGKLSEVELPDRLIKIGENAFSGTKLSSVVFPPSLRYVGRSSFSSCPLKSVEFPEGMLSIGASAFNGCNDLTSVTIPRTVRIIGEKAFYCSIDPFRDPAPRTITNWSREPQDIAEYTFHRYQRNGIIPAPQDTLRIATGCKELYEGAEYWRDFVIIIEDATAIHPACKVADTSPINYDLFGRPANVDRKGILIKNGKKILIR